MKTAVKTAALLSLCRAAPPISRSRAAKYLPRLLVLLVLVLALVLVVDSTKVWSGQITVVAQPDFFFSVISPAAV
jgi:hypothetical protein